MTTKFESDRLVFREIIPEDETRLFEMDSDPEVCKYLGVKPLHDIWQTREMIHSIRQQYMDYGIGRWAVVLKDRDNGEQQTGGLIGWAGLKFIKKLNGFEDNYDLGYRFIRRYWGNGYGYESAKAWVDFGFNEMKLARISAYIDVNNIASQKILEKCGLTFVNTFLDQGDVCAWYETRKEQG
jgi:RimJ/RimL family protein N-acetyltransferase